MIVDINISPQNYNKNEEKPMKKQYLKSSWIHHSPYTMQLFSPLIKRGLSGGLNSYGLREAAQLRQNVMAGRVPGCWGA